MYSPAHWMLLLLFGLELSGASVKSKTPLVTLEELRSLNASCDGLDTCRGRARGDDDMIHDSRTRMRGAPNCQCGPYCVRYGTCCMDAAFRGGDYKRGLNCSTTYGSSESVFLVEKCPREWDGDDSVRDLCLANAEDYDDVMLLVPVSSLKTGITYRNYFCYVCNTVDDIDDTFISWDVRVTIHNGIESLFVDLSTLTHDPRRNEWTFPGLPQHRPLALKTEPPEKLLENFSIYCRNMDVISACAADWRDKATRSKCGFYTALVIMTDGSGRRNMYRNVHCGICNWANTATIECGFRDGYFALVPRPAKVFQELFRISEVPEDSCAEGKLYDKVTKTCRNLRCGRKMEMVKGRCVRKK